MPLLVGLDVGTTSSKAVVIDLEGNELAHGRAPTRWQRTAHGTETSAGALLDGARLALQQALSAAPHDEVLGLGVASMAESGVLLDRGGRPAGPVIAWHDARDAAEVEDARAALGAEEYARRTGLPLRSQWSLTKHRWLLSHDRAAAADAARRLNIAEWVVRSLGGDEASEQSLASRTGWLDITSRNWWPAAVEWSGIRQGMLPPLVTAGTALGTVPAEAGIPRLAGVTLTVAGHDHQAAAIGAGATGPGDELDSCGTAEALVRTVPVGLSTQAILELTRAGITVGWHALPGYWCLLAGTQGGLIMQRVLGMLGVDHSGLAALDTAALREAAPASPPEVRLTGDGLVNVLGIGAGVTPGGTWRATLAEVTAQARQVHDSMTAVAGERGKLVVTGGWARSATVLAVKRQFFGSLLRPAVAEAGARGAALLAGIAAGAYPGAACLPAPRYRSCAGFSAA
jgi:sugar (pentulose or hexulose) kinase